MIKPTSGSLGRLRRIGRYLNIKEVQALWLSLRLLWLMCMTAELRDWECVQPAGPPAVLVAEPTVENCNHSVTMELAFADSMLMDPWLVNQ